MLIEKFPNASFNRSVPKSRVIDFAAKQLSELRIGIKDQNFTKEWGGYFNLEDDSANILLPDYFPHYSHLQSIPQKLSFKFMICGPDEEASGQSHERRSEYWAPVFGNLMVVSTDKLTRPEHADIYKPGDVTFIPLRRIHQFRGAGHWVGFFEIWRHINHGRSDEDDITRYWDKYGRVML